MRVVMLDAPDELIAERRRLGLDGHDEVWEGEYHVVPPANTNHMRLESLLLRALAPVAALRGLEVLAETGLYDPTAPGHTSFRVPDLVTFSAEHASERGVEGRAELVVEILSPGDETYEKLPFYERVGVQELLVIDRGTKALRHWTRLQDRLVETGEAVVTLRALDARLSSTDRTLTVETAGTSHQI